MNKTHIILLSIFLVTVIPTIYVFIEHGYVEQIAYNKSIETGNEYKATKQLGELLLFYSIAIGYIITTILIIIKPRSKIPYLVVLIGTVAIIFVYYFRIYGIPIPFTDIVIRDLTTDWRDVVTKICQQILVIPIALMLRGLYK